MKTNDKQKLHQNTIEELTQKILVLQQELVQKKAELKLTKLTNVKTVKNLKHQIAIIKTIITQKRLQTN